MATHGEKKFVDMFNTVPAHDRQTNGHTCNTVNSGVARGQDKDECSQSDLKKNLGHVIKCVLTVVIEKPWAFNINTLFCNVYCSE